MKGFFVIYYDDIRGPILEDRLIYLLDPSAVVNEDLARQIFYSLNLQQESTQNFQKFYTGSDEICTYFTSRVRRDDIPVIFNVILEADESREKYYGFIQKWAKYLYDKMLEGEGFTINPIINDVERRIETVDYQHARFKFLANKKHWELLEERLKKGDGQSQSPELKKMQIFGFLDQDGHLKRKDFLDMVDFILTPDFSDMPTNYPEVVGLALRAKTKQKLEGILGIYNKARSARDVHFLGQPHPQGIFALLEDAITYRIYQFFSSRVFATSNEIAKGIGVDQAQVNDYLEFLGKSSPLFATVKDGENCYASKVLSIELTIPYFEDPSQVEIKNKDLRRDATIIELAGVKYKQQRKPKQKRPEPEIPAVEPPPVTPVAPPAPAPATPQVQPKPAVNAATSAQTQVTHVEPPAQRAQAPIPYVQQSAEQSAPLEEAGSSQEISLTPAELKLIGQVFAKYY